MYAPMINTLWTSATGMRAQQFNIDTIANNLTIVSILPVSKKAKIGQDTIIPVGICLLCLTLTIRYSLLYLYADKSVRGQIENVAQNVPTCIHYCIDPNLFRCSLV